MLQFLCTFAFFQLIMTDYTALRRYNAYRANNGFQEKHGAYIY